jgi:hypothetical protein
MHALSKPVSYGLPMPAPEPVIKAFFAFKEMSSDRGGKPVSTLFFRLILALSSLVSAYGFVQGNKILLRS